MQVVITNADLRRCRSCRGAYTNREWDPELNALVFPDWDASVKELLSTPKGRGRLEWYVRHKLVPMTPEEFAAAQSAQGDANG